MPDFLASANVNVSGSRFRAALLVVRSLVIIAYPVVRSVYR
jgi:hypothetical protein